MRRNPDDARPARNVAAQRRPRLPALGPRGRHWPVVLALLALGPIVSRAADPENCLLCHRFRGLSRYDAQANRVHVFFIDPDYVEGLAGPHARLACSACHTRNEVAVIPHQPVSRVGCTQVCHLTAPGEMERLFSHANVAAMLDQSVHSQRLLSELTFSHGPLLDPNQSQCLYCHDEPVFRSPTGVVPSLSILGPRTFDRCDVCHAGQIPVDVAYYLRHITARLQPARPTLGLAQVCAVCHADPGILQRYKLKNTVASYVQSFHGTAALLGEQRTADCLSCHVAAGANAHLMFGRTDPRSSVSPQNVASTCRSTACHPGAEPQFADVSVHLDLPTARATLEFGVAAAFILLTIGTFGPSLLLCVLELAQIVIGRHHHERRSALVLVQAVLAHPLGRRRLTRFTVSQRYQHWILVLLFVTLALTGFALKFAQRGWAQSVIGALGGLAAARNIHHWAGIALVLGFVAHCGYALTVLFKLAGQRGPDRRRRGLFPAIRKLPMILWPTDLKKGYALLLYLVGLRPDPPTFGRFTIKEKFEYIGVFWGTTLLGLTGVLLWGVQFFSAYINGRIFSIALIAHTYEAFLAIIHVGILHIVNVIFAPNVFPLSPATITGFTPAAELAESHREFVAEAAQELGVALPEGLQDE
jgi:cytochrome b subunit of formate dehydrogenase